MKKRGKRGPKTKLTKELQTRICALLRAAHTIQTCCYAVEISERSFFTWCEQNPAFAAAARKARTLAKIRLVGIIQNAARTDARHAEWLLERSGPTEYSRVTMERVEQIGDERRR